MAFLSTLRRLVRRDPGFAAIAVLTLALGIGATVAIFTVVNGILFESLPYPESDRIVSIDHAAPGLDLPNMGISRKLYLHYLENAKTLDGIAVRDHWRMTLTGDGEPERVAASSVTPSFFRVLGVSPLHGRTFSEEEAKPGGPDVAVLSHGLWQRRFGGDRSILGKVIQGEGLSYEVVGVLPESFVDDQEVEIYRPRQIDPARAQLGAFSDQAIARLATDASLEQARADLERLTTGLDEWFPEDGAAVVLGRADFAPQLVPLLEARVGDLRSILWVLLGTVGVILTIACANVANLFLVRVEERSHELGVRSALGAGRRRIIRELLTESVSLAVVAGIFGLVIAQVGVRLVQRFGPQTLPRLDEVAINGRVLLFALVVTLVSGLLFGLLPSLRAGTERLLASLRDGTRSSSVGKRQHLVRAVLVAGQVALGLVLLVGCGLLVRTLLELRAADPGFEPADTLTFRVTLPETEYENGEAVLAFVDASLERIRALPGVESAGVATTLPMNGQTSGSGYAVEDFPPQEDSLPPVFMDAHLSNGYLETIGARLVEGRYLTEAETRDRTGKALVSRSVKQRFWPGESALGKRIYPSRSSEEQPWYEIVGVVDDIYMMGIDEGVRDFVWKPALGFEDAGQDLGQNLSFVVGTQLSEESLIPALRAEIWALDRNVPIAQVKTMERIVQESRGQVSFTVVILLIASGLALLLAAIGLYGVVSYVVSKRTREFGVRLAMGASRRDVVGLVLRGGLLVSSAGVAAGLLLALGTTRFLESMLFGVSKYDPPTFTVVPAVLLLVSAIASWIPALRASAVEPVSALRQD